MAYTKRYMKEVKPLCPVCQKSIIDLRTYKDGSKLYVHRQGITRMGGMAFCNIIESCTVPAPVSAGQ